MIWLANRRKQIRILYKDYEDNNGKISPNSTLGDVGDYLVWTAYNIEQFLQPAVGNLRVVPSIFTDDSNPHLIPLMMNYEYILNYSLS